MSNPPQKTAAENLFMPLVDSIEKLLAGKGYNSFTGEWGQGGFVRLWNNQSRSPIPLIIFSATETEPGRYLVELNGGSYQGHNKIIEFSAMRIEGDESTLEETISKRNEDPFLQCVEFARKMAENLTPQDLIERCQTPSK